MKELNGKVAVITGAAVGMGRGLALELAHEGCKVALADINKKELEETARQVKTSGGIAETFIVDMSKKKDVYDFAEDVVKKFKQVDILINNAGVILVSPIKEMTDKDFNWIININLWGVIHGTMAFLPHLKKRKESNLVNISSTYGLISIPLHSAYCTSKFAVRGFTESLIMELHDTPVSVSDVYPNLIKTNIAPSGNYSGLENYIDTSEMVDNFYEAFKSMGPREAAKIIVKNAVKKNKPRVIVGPMGGLVDRLGRFFPNSYYKIILKQMIYKLFGKETFIKMTN